MGFRKFTTYNTHDTNYFRGERHLVQHGVKDRCDRIVKIFARHTIALGANNVLDQFYKVGLTSYTYLDIAYAIRKLESLDVLKRDAIVPSLYRLASEGKAIWKEVRST